MSDKTYIAIDLKSFYASVECMDRGLDPLTTHLVVADAARTEKTICLAVSPSLKAYGISGRARLFEAIQKVQEVNARRRHNAPDHTFRSKTSDDTLLKSDPSLALDFVIAPPRMAHYMAVSTQIYDIYLKYVAPEDIHVYSIDEVFIDATAYLCTYHLTAREFAMKLIREVLQATGITATAGIGTNLYLCKIAMDVEAKHIPPDKDGVRIAELDEISYRQKLWDHRPLTDFWRVGPGIAKKLEARGIYTMGDIARVSLRSEELLYELFGVNAELLIDHAWGWEPCTIADIKAYKPQSNSVGSGQVLHRPYTFNEARLIVREMVELLVLDLVDHHLLTDQMVLTVGYDIENVSAGAYSGEITVDRYGRKIPKHAHGTANLGKHTSSTMKIVEATMALYDRIVDRELLVRRINLVANHVLAEDRVPAQGEQLDLFTDSERLAKERIALAREKKKQQAMLAIQKKYGKNAVLKGFNLEKGATTIDRNRQIGGHKA
ncbi:MAG: DNA methylase [Eubacteriales bacterium]|nr:DNA methylase [Eubacteriales bacterium]